ncbi:MAG: cytochrome b/b6 domain-containing protein, partial [Ketobacter sp.]
MQLDSPSQFSKTTLTLHWIVAITVISLLAVGIYMDETGTHSLYPWHKSFGFVIFFVILARVIWRIKNGWPVPVSQYQSWETLLA